MVICRKEQSPVKDLFLQIDVTERLFCHVISEEVRWIEKTQKARVKKRITQGNSIEHGNERGWYKTKKIKKKRRSSTQNNCVEEVNKVGSKRLWEVDGMPVSADVGLTWSGWATGRFQVRRRFCWTLGSQLGHNRVAMVMEDGWT